jgi:hypothetical protein
MRLRSAVALLVAGIVLVFCSVVGGREQVSITRRLLKVEDATDLLDATHKAALLLPIQHGSNQYVALPGDLLRPCKQGSDGRLRRSVSHFRQKRICAKFSRTGAILKPCSIFASSSFPLSS